MSLTKAIEHGKERRKPRRYRPFSERACHNHGGCSWCLENRMHSTKKRRMKGVETDEIGRD